jgi:hypothetical protein
MKLQSISILGGKNNKGGKIMYFGIERAIKEDSPGLLFQNAHLLQFINLYKKDKNLLPKSIVEQVVLKLC